MEMQEAGRQAMSRMPFVGIDKHAGRLLMTEALEVHRQEGNIGTDVVPAQDVRKFEAVENAYAVVKAVDVRGLQVTMAIADVPVRHPGLEEGSVRPEPLNDQASDLSLNLGIQWRVDEPRDFLEVVLPFACQGWRARTC